MESGFKLGHFSILLIKPFQIEFLKYVQGAYDKFPDFFRMGI